MPCQIPGFGEKPEEWIVDSIVSHHGKGVDSEFQVLWKAGDKTWAQYREVAHLNALDRYCELMGVKDVSELPGNYTYEDSEDEDEENIIQARVCEVRTDKRESDTTEDCYIRSDSTTYSTIYNMVRSTLSNNDLRDCLAYEHRLNAYRLGVATQPKNPPPNRWDDFLNEQETLFARRPAPSIDPRFHPGMPNHQSPVENVYMPVETLNSIIKAIRQSTRAPPAPIPKPLPVNRFVPKRPPPPPNFNRGGRGGFGGRGWGKGPVNHKGKRVGRTEDPRRNKNVGNPTLPSAPIEPNPINANETSIEDELAFLNEFASTGITSGNDDILMGGSGSNIASGSDDIPMDNSGNITTEEGFTV